MNNITKSNKRKFSNFSQYSGKSMVRPVDCTNQELMILEGLHPKMQYNPNPRPMTKEEREELKTVKAANKQIFSSNHISSRDKDANYTVKVMVHLVNTTKDNTFKTTYTEYMELSEVERYILTEFKFKGLKPSKIRVDNEIIYSIK